MIKIQNQRN